MTAVQTSVFIQQGNIKCSFSTCYMLGIEHEAYTEGCVCYSKSLQSTRKMKTDIVKIIRE